MSGRRKGGGKTTAARPRKAASNVVAAPRQPSARRLRARYDAAQTTEENRRHWAMADGLSADAAASPGVRKKLRERARYEVANNTYAAGIVDTLANHCIGTGVRLQLTGVSRADAKRVEDEFALWAAAVDLPEKLKTMRSARAVDGEAFGILTQNDALPTAVKLDLRLVEADQVATPSVVLPRENAVDGIQFDRAGNPIAYDVLHEHPGSNAISMVGDAQRVPAADMLHVFIPKRPGQRRGVPEITPALPLFAQLRRWTLSTLAAAETASDFAALLYTEAPPDGEVAASDPWDRIEIERRAMMTIPAGWKLSQLKAEQPTSTYAEVKREILGEIARCLSMPYNIAAGNSASYNYASGRLDHQTYFHSIRVDRVRFQVQVLERLFAAWRREAVLIEGYLPQSLRSVKTDWSHGWFWDGFEHVDPEKEANAQATRLANKTTTLAKEHGRAGDDWEEQIEQIAKERARIAELEKKYGVSLSDIVAPSAKPAQQQAEDDEEDDVEDEEDADGEEQAEDVEATTILRDADGRPTGIVRSKVKARRGRAAPRRRKAARR